MENSAWVNDRADPAEKPMRVLFVTPKDPLYARFFFGEFLERCGPRYGVAGIVVSGGAMTRRALRDIRHAYGMYGILDQARLAWRYYRSKADGMTLESLAFLYGVALYREEELEDYAVFNVLAQQRIDIVVSLGVPGAASGRLARLAKWGCVNIHQARLTDYRGLMPGFWQLYNEEKNACVTIHKMAATVREDKVMLQKEFPIWVDESLDNLMVRLWKTAAQSLLKVLELVRSRRVSYLSDGVLQPGAYFSLPTREDIREFKRRGKRIF
jgi:methionyl-tRNA formyltransferase